MRCGLRSVAAPEAEMSDLLESLAERLQCAHLAVHAPIWNADLVAPAPPQDVAQNIRALTRELLWWMAREHADARMLNRMRLKSGGPIVPFRVLLCPLREEGSTVGLLAALRTREQPPFETADLGVLSDAAPALHAGANILAIEIVRYGGPHNASRTPMSAVVYIESTDEIGRAHV